MNILRYPAVAALVVMMTACAVQPKYNWGNYDRSLYNYYKDSTKSAEHMAELATIVSGSETSGKKVAPGIHAEYGYLLLQKGQKTEAIGQFEKEKAKWPESAQFMDVMIKSAGAKVTAAAAKE
jgi:hypothetical protein